MLFNSIEFLFFLTIVFSIYWLLKDRLKSQNLFILIASYIFYGWWDWRFLILIFISTLVDFITGISLFSNNEPKKRKLLLFFSIFTNLVILCFFKYYDFFVESFTDLFSLFGITLNTMTLNIILPVGISFYTFQTMSYTIDVYRKEMIPTKDFISFASFVSFFPQLVAGPIEKAKNLLPQFYKKREFDYSTAVDGVRQILWGFMKKVLIADNCGKLIDPIFNSYQDYNGSTLFLSVILFGFQLYCDFSGYSDIAIGTAKLFGIKLRRNFNYPLFSRNTHEFWTKWHISLNKWFRDYVYLPLRKKSGKNSYNTLFITLFVFILTGLWHGANQTFVVWGLYCGVMTVTITPKSMRHIPHLFQILIVSIIFILSLVLFRSNTLTDAFNYYSIIFSKTLFSLPILNTRVILTLLGIVSFVMVEWRQRDKEHPLQFGKINIYVRWCIYFIITMLIYLFYVDSKMFIYFQF